MAIDPARCPVPDACAAGCGREIGLGPDADEGVPFVCLFCTEAGCTLPAPAPPDAEVERATALLRSLPPGSGSGWPELQQAGYSRAVADAALCRVLAEEVAPSTVTPTRIEDVEPEHYDHVRRKADGLETIVIRIGCGTVELSSTSSQVHPYTTDHVQGFWTRWVRA